MTISGAFEGTWKEMIVIYFNILKKNDIYISPALTLKKSFFAHTMWLLVSYEIQIKQRLFRGNM
jgi:hypothetical protein